MTGDGCGDVEEAPAKGKKLPAQRVESSQQLDFTSGARHFEAALVEFRQRNGSLRPQAPLACP